MVALLGGFIIYELLDLFVMILLLMTNGMDLFWQNQ